jgi:hypothetical protein
MSAYRLGAYLALIAGLTACTCHLLALSGVGGSGLRIVFQVLLWAFLVSSVAMLFSGASPAAVGNLYVAPWRKLLLNALAVLWLAYTAALVVHNLRPSAGFVGGEQQLKRLWSSSAYMWVFMVEWSFWSERSRSPGSSSGSRRVRREE